MHGSLASDRRSRFGAFSHLPFSVLWAATTCSLTGVAISDTASSWLMTNLDPDPRAVSLVQVVSSLPMFLFTLPAGALADLVEPRRFLIGLESLISSLILMFGTLVYFKAVSGEGLLAATFTLGALWSLAAPAWLSITPLLVPAADLDSANGANSVGYNVSRTLGPVLAGLALTSLGSAAPYWIFGGADLVSVAALLWWRPPARAASSVPRESWAGSVLTGLRHVSRNRDLRNTLIRAAAVYPFACAYTALLPLIAHDQLGQGPRFFGILLAAISLGAIGGSLLLGRLRGLFGPDAIVALGTLGIAAALVLFALARGPALGVGAALLAGVSWTIVLVGLYVSAMISLPENLLGRGLAIFLTVIFGSVTAGSLLWGQLAKSQGLSFALLAAAAAMVAMIPLSRGAHVKAPIGDGGAA